MAINPLSSASKIPTSIHHTQKAGFLKEAHACIQAQQWEDAVSVLSNSFAIEDPTQCYHFLFQALPHCDALMFGKVEKHLPLLLERSPSFIHEQRQLSLLMAQWHIDHLNPQPLFVNSLCSAMHYLAKAFQIAQLTNNQEDQQQIHLKASHLLMRWIQEVTVKKLKEQLDQARRSAKPEQFKSLIHHIEKLRQFCLTQEDHLLIQSLYRHASDVISTFTTVEKKKEYGLLFIQQGLSEDFIPQEICIKRYEQALQQFRSIFSSAPPFTTPAEVRQFQKKASEAFKNLFKTLLDDAIALLGPPPGGYDIRAMGSCGREEVCPYSDLEFMILIEDDSHAPYFKTLVQILDIQIASFGETSTGHPPFTAIHHQNLSGFHIDMSPASNPDLIRIPLKMAQMAQSPCHHPQNIEQTVLKTWSLACSHPTLFEEYQNHLKQLLPPSLGQERARSFFKQRLKDYGERWKSDFPIQEGVIDLKRDYVEVLNHLLGDLALYCSISATNTLDIIDALAEQNIFTQESAVLLKESVATIYTLRLRVHNHSKTQQESIRIPELVLFSSIPSSSLQDASLLTLQHSDVLLLEKIKLLVLDPLYSRLQAILFQESPFYKQEELLSTAFTEALHRSSIDSHLHQRLIYHVALHLTQVLASLDQHRFFYDALSRMRETEPLREIYLDVLEDHQDASFRDLVWIPSISGLRSIFLRQFQQLERGLLAMSDEKEPPLPIRVCVTTSSVQGRYLKPEVIQSLLDEEGNIQKTYPHSAHAVSRVVYGEYDFHFKQKPSHPLMEYAIHNLYFRIAGSLTPAVELARFDIHQPGKKRSYPVLVSQTIPGSRPSEHPAIDDRQWTWMVLCCLLTRPGDGRLSNYIFQGNGNMYCIDNDISFVEPVVKTWTSRNVQLAAAPFCLRPLDTPLNLDVLEEFSRLDVVAILDSWIGDVIQQEKVYTQLFPEDIRRSLYKEDPINNFTTSILFREGTLATLNLQFVRLQTCMSQALSAKKRPTAGDLLQELVSIREEAVGVYVYKAYQAAFQFPLEQRIQQATWSKTGQSMTSSQYHQACLGKIPTFEEIEKSRLYSPEKARQEFFFSLLHNSNYSLLKIDHDLTSLTANFKGLQDTTRQTWVLKALAEHIKSLEVKPRSVTLQHCNVLSADLLTPFLHPELEKLDLRYSSIDDIGFKQIDILSPRLKTLSLSGCSKLTKMSGPFYKPILEMPYLEHLDCNRCESLHTIQLSAPHLRILETKHNQQLKILNLKTIDCCVDIQDSPQAKLSHDLKAFGKIKWNQYFGDIGVEPPLPPNIQEILSSPCPIWPGKKVQETHLLVLIPQTVNGRPPLTLKSLEELVKAPKQRRATRRATQFRALYLGEYTDTPAPASHWVLMTRDVLPESRNKSYADQQALVSRYAQKSSVPYQVPNILDAAVCIFMEYIQSGKRLYGDDPWAYTRCQEKYDASWQLAVGGFSPAGLCVRHDYDRYDFDDVGVGCLRKF